MSVTGVSGGSVTPDPTIDATTTTDTATTATTSDTLTHGPFAAHAELADVLAGGAAIGMGAEGAFVMALEQALISLGYSIPGPGQPNDRLTMGTVNALSQFQRDNGLTASGSLDAGTLRALDGAAATAAGGTAAPAAPAAPSPTDFVSKDILEKYGLNTEGMTTESKYEGAEWSVGYYPYSGDVQYTAFGKHAAVFGGEARGDSHAHFEFYSNPPGGLQAGSRVDSGTIGEYNFEHATGVDITGNRPIGNDAYKLLREAGGKAENVALRTGDGKDIPLEDSDVLVPTIMKDGKPAQITLKGDGGFQDPATGESVGGWDSQTEITWRIQRDGQVLHGDDHKTETRDELLGLGDDVAFDFLDASGQMVGFSPGRDRIAECFQDGDAWHVLAKKDDGSFEHQVVNGDSVTSTETLDEAAATALKDGKETMYRVQNLSTGALAGDGKASGRYDMSWWGKCHNVASIGTSNLPRPKQEVNVVTNLGAGDEVGLRWGDNLLVPQRGTDGAISGYEHQVRAADGSVTNTSSVSLDDAKTLAADNKAGAVVVGSDGSLRDAVVTNFDTSSTDALVAHIGNGAVDYVGNAGSRYYAHPDIFVLKDGTQVQGHIKDAKTEAGKTLEIGTREGFDYHEVDRSELRGPGMDSRVLSAGTGRSHAFNVQDLAKLNEHREDDITAFTIIKSDGTEETIEADKVDLFAWENKFDFRPDQLWDLHKTVTKDGSTVVEADPDTHVWNYTIEGANTTVLDPASLDSYEKEASVKPGMLTGSVGEEGKRYFETSVNYNDYKYWVKFDDAGDISDYGYLGNDVPDFVWTQHVKKDAAWTGESQAPGVKNGDIQRMYYASVGRLDSHSLPGGFISTADLKSAPAAPPED